MWWLRNNNTHNLAPIDAEPSDKGNIVIDLKGGEYSVLPKNLFTPGDTPRHTNHFVTCPNAARHHKSKKK